MKNKLGKIENLKEYHENGKLAYVFEVIYNDYSYEATYDDQGNRTSCKDSNGESYEATFDDQGNVTSYKDLRGYSWKRIYKEDGTYEQIDL